MSHSAPIPPGNQSPYPIAEPPHVHATDAVATTDTPILDRVAEVPPKWIAGAVMIGAAALIGAAFAFRWREPAEPRASRRKPSTRKPRAKAATQASAPVKRKRRSTKVVAQDGDDA